MSGNLDSYGSPWRLDLRGRSLEHDPLDLGSSHPDGGALGEEDVGDFLLQVKGAENRDLVGRQGVLNEGGGGVVVRGVGGGGGRGARS